MSVHRAVARQVSRPISRSAVSLSAALALTGAGLVATAPSSSAAAETGTYLVVFSDEPAATYDGNVAGYARTRPDSGKKLDPTRTEVQKWRGRLTSLHDSVLQRVGGTKLADYTVATNGVAATLTAGQVRQLSRTAGVVRVEKDAERQLDTTYSPTFLGLNKPGGLWEQTGGDKEAGQGVSVGVIDSGIGPESASVAGKELKRDAAGQPVEASGLRGTWFGPCVQGENFSSQACNDKLIGARYYVAGFGKKNVSKDDYLSPRDGGGHGSHTASTAAGNQVPHVTIDGADLGTASGMAPGAKVAAYTVCWEAKPGASAGCFNSDSVAAIDDAVADGVDVLNYSVGGSSESSPLDVVEQAFRRAANVGVFVANSAGNSGPGASTLDHPSPWLTTVAASTFRNAENAVVLGDGERFVGASITPTLPTSPLVSATTVGLAGAAPDDVRRCFAGTLDPAKATGKVVQCDRGVNARIDKGFEVKRAGGVGMILTNTSANSLNSDFQPVPSVHVDEKARAAILAYLATAGSSATAKIVPLDPGESKVKTPEVAEFSSRGPSTTTGGDILKPDLAAPGVDVLAAVAPPSNHGRSYDFYSGTSMSSPHVAGIGALLKSLHPTWSPAEVKSALMTSARDHVSTTDPFAQGAGFVDPNRAADPGLVFDARANDWRGYLKSLGVQFAPAYDSVPVIDGSDLNQASIAIGALAGKQTVTRTVTNVGQEEQYTVSSDVPGIDVSADVPSFTPKAGAAQVLRLTLTRTSATLGDWAKGFVYLKSAHHTVRVPVAVRPVEVAAPAEVSGTGTSGSATISVVPGFTGTLTTATAGLVGSTPRQDSVVNGAFAPTASASTKAYTLTVAPGTKLARFDVDAAGTTDDLDLYVYYGGQQVALSASASGDEQVTLTDPAPGDYTAYVNGYDTATDGGKYAYTDWAVSGPTANLTATDNVPVTAGTPVDVTATWTGLSTDKRWLGFVSYGSGTDRTVLSVG